MNTHSPDDRQVEDGTMPDGSSADLKRRRGQGRREKTPWIETIGGELRVWRHQDTNEIVIEPPVFAAAKKCEGLITLSVRDARHLANSLLLFAAETESSPAANAATSSIQVDQEAEKTE
jgi:hypothetical protein